jgi:glycosyltransferase involved in cell wall biosynthesis
MGNPKVSIIVPVYNVEKYLNKCIDSILSQTFTDFECILVDDCSPDNCPKICDEYAQKDSRVKVIHKPQNAGLPLARKTGMEASRGEYIQHTDSDDWIEPDMVETMYEKARSGNYDIVYCDYYNYDRDGHAAYQQSYDFSNDRVKTIKEVGINSQSGGSYLWNKLFKRRLYDNVIFYKENYCEDKCISTQIFYFAETFYHIHQAFYHYRFNPKSLARDKKIWKTRLIEIQINLEHSIDFLKTTYGNDLSMFEEAIEKRRKDIKMLNPWYYKRVIIRILHILVPFYSWRQALKKIYRNGKRQLKQWRGA